MTKIDELVSVANELPAEAVTELLERARELAAHSTRQYTPVVPGGLWAGIDITDEDLRAARHEMWSLFEAEEIE